MYIIHDLERKQYYGTYGWTSSRSLAYQFKSAGEAKAALFAIKKDRDRKMCIYEKY
jgi:hypothetical protein